MFARAVHVDGRSLGAERDEQASRRDASDVQTPAASHDPQESNRLLLELNRAIAAGEIEYHPFD